MTAIYPCNKHIHSQLQKAFVWNSHNEIKKFLVTFTVFSNNHGWTLNNNLLCLSNVNSLNPLVILFQSSIWASGYHQKLTKIPLNISKNLWFYDVFGGYRKIPVTWNRLGETSIRPLFEFINFAHTKFKWLRSYFAKKFLWQIKLKFLNFLHFYFCFA